MFAFSFIRRHILKLPCTKNSSGIIPELGVRCWYQPFRMEVNPIKCLMCGVNYHSESDRLQHLQGKRHKSNFDNDLGILHRSIEVSWSSRWLENEVLMDYFSNYGEIEKFYCDTRKNYAFVYFNNSLTVNNILQRDDHSVNGISIKIKKRAYQTRATKIKSQVKENTEYKNHFKLMTKLHNIETMSEQMKTIKETLGLTQSQLKERADVANSVTQIFRPFIPACTVHVFGSSANGFGMKGGDIDLFLDLHEDQINPANQTVITPERSLFHRIPSKVDNSKFFNFYNLTLKEQIVFTANVLRSNRSFSQNIQCISRARCPVVKFKHVFSGLDCDISINNRIALRNTKLLSLYGSLDERVKDLVFTVRYWGKKHQIASSDMQEMSSYALTSLVIFFLQNTEPPVLPTLQTLRSLTDERVIIDDWDCSFTDDISVIPKTTNTDTAGQLFKKFLDFYKKIVFNNMIIKCNQATILPVKGSSELLTTNLSVKSVRNFRFGEMNVQDPFVLGHNLTLRVHAEKKNWFKMCLNFSSVEMKKYLDLNQENMALIRALDPIKSTTLNTNSSRPYTFPIDLHQEVTFNENVKMSDYQWCVHVCQFLEKLLSDILHIGLTVEQNNIMSEKEFKIKTQDNEGELPDTEKETNNASSEVLADFEKKPKRHYKPILSNPKKQDNKGELTDSEHETNMASSEVLADFDEKRDNQTLLDPEKHDISTLTDTEHEIKMADSEVLADFDEISEEHNIITEQETNLGETGTFASHVLADFDDISDKQNNPEEHFISKLTNTEQETNLGETGTFASHVLADFDDISDKQNNPEEHFISKLTNTEQETNLGETGTFASQVLADFDDISDKQNNPEEHFISKLTNTEQETNLGETGTFASQVLADFDEISDKQTIKRELFEPEEHSAKRTKIDAVIKCSESEILMSKDIISKAMSSEIDSIDLGEIVFQCHAENIPFTGRQKIEKEIRMEQVIHDLALEKEISKRIIERGDQNKIKLDFKCILKPSISQSHTRVTVSFEQPTNVKSKHFNFIYEFLKPYILKMFKKDLYNASENEKSDDDKIRGERS